MEARQHTGVADAMPGALYSRLLAGDRLNELRRIGARAHVRWLVGILLVALVVRVLWVAAVQPDPRDGRFDDTVWYYNTARLLSEGEGYVNYAERTPTALWAPGYPLVLAGLFRLPGDDVSAARALNVLAGLTLVAGVYYLGSQLWDVRAGLLAAGMMALFPSPIYFSSLLLTESLYVAMSIGLLALALAWTSEEPVPGRRLLVLGLVVGALAMVRPEGIIFVAAIALFWLAAYRSWRRLLSYASVTLLGVAVMLAPWVVRNAIQLDSFIVGTTGMGQVLVQGHRPDADGRPDLYAVTTLWKRFEDVPLPEREIRINNAGVRESVSYAVRHIPRELSLAPHRLAWFFRGDDSVMFWLQHAGPGQPKEMSLSWEDRWGTLANVYYYAVVGMMVLGLPFWFRRMRAGHVLLWGPFAVYTAMWAFLFVGEARYHFPLLPIFAVLAAIGLSSALQYAQRRFRPRPTG